MILEKDIWCPVLFLETVFNWTWSLSGSQQALPIFLTSFLTTLGLQACSCDLIWTQILMLGHKTLLPTWVLPYHVFMSEFLSLYLFYFLFLFLWDRVLLCSHDWCGTHRQTRIASNSQRSACLHFTSTGIKYFFYVFLNYFKNLIMCIWVFFMLLFVCATCITMEVRRGCWICWNWSYRCEPQCVCARNQIQDLCKHN